MCGEGIRHARAGSGMALGLFWNDYDVWMSEPWMVDP